VGITTPATGTDEGLMPLVPTAATGPLVAGESLAAAESGLATEGPTESVAAVGTAGEPEAEVAPDPVEIDPEAVEPDAPVVVVVEVEVVVGAVAHGLIHTVWNLSSEPCDPVTSTSTLAWYPWLAGDIPANAAAICAGEIGTFWSS
jgi:hypothetical protein